MANEPGRNDLCPCGSGKKFKDCCIDKVNGDLKEARRRYLAILNQSTAAAIAEWAGRKIYENTPFDFEADPSTKAMTIFYALYDNGPKQRSWASHYAELGFAPSPEIYDWIQAQRQVWLGVWEITDVEPGHYADMHCHLTNERRRVYERAGTLDLHPGQWVVARVVHHEGIDVMSGLYPVAFSMIHGKQLAEDILEYAKSTLKLKFGHYMTPAQAARFNVKTFALIITWHLHQRIKVQVPTPMTFESSETTILEASPDRPLSEEAQETMKAHEEKAAEADAAESKL